MGACSSCYKLQDGQCTAYLKAQEILGRAIPPPPLGACEIAIAESYLQVIQPGMTVLEIGCGSWDLLKAYCETVGATYEGIDVQREYFGKPTIATRLENLADLSFADESFDLVIGNQTMEHWAEYGCSLAWGLYQCFRVCQVGGQILLNVPIHFHGTKPFLLGNIPYLQDLFRPFSNQLILTQWGLPSFPLADLYPHPGYWHLKHKPAYVLDIRAVKDKPLPASYHNNFASKGIWAQLLNYPLSYNVYRLFRKLGYR